MVNAQFSRHVASLETREGCPITPGASFTKTFFLVPLASSNKDRRGIALDGYLKVGHAPSMVRDRGGARTTYLLWLVVGDTAFLARCSHTSHSASRTTT